MAIGSRLLLLAQFLVSASCAGLWISQPNMLYARSDHTADAVSSGTQKVIVVFGGCVSGNDCPPNTDYCFCSEITNKTTAFDPEQGTWRDLATAPAPRYRHMSAVVGSLLFIFGGRDLDDNILTTVLVFNLTSNKWATSTNWPGATSDGTAFVYNNTIYAVGGYDQNYDSSNVTWIFRPLSSAPIWLSGVVAPMKMGRGDSCSAIVNGVGYVLGGWSDANFCVPLAEVEGYNFVTNTWTVDAVMRVGGGDKSCSGLHNQLHVFGGEQKDVNCSRFSTPITDVEVYNPLTNTWTAETPMRVPRFRFAAVDWVSSSGVEQLFVFGGQGAYNVTAGELPALNLVQVFNDADPLQPSVSSAFMLAASGLMVTVLAGVLVAA